MANIKLKRVTLSYPNLHKPKSFGNDASAEPKFSCSLILDKKKDAGQIKMLQEKIAEALKEAKMKTNKICLHDGSESDKEGYGPGVMFLRCSSSQERPPYTVDRNPNKRLTPEDDKIYGGAIVNAEVSIWLQRNSFGERANCNIIGVQYVEEGTRFGDSPVDPTESCENLEEEEAGVL